MVVLHTQEGASVLNYFFDTLQNTGNIPSRHQGHIWKLLEIIWGRTQRNNTQGYIAGGLCRNYVCKVPTTQPTDIDIWVIEDTPTDWREVIQLSLYTLPLNITVYRSNGSPYVRWLAGVREYNYSVHVNGNKIIDIMSVKPSHNIQMILDQFDVGINQMYIDKLYSSCTIHGTDAAKVDLDNKTVTLNPRYRDTSYESAVRVSRILDKLNGCSSNTRDVLSTLHCRVTPREEKIFKLTKPAIIWKRGESRPEVPPVTGASTPRSTRSLYQYISSRSPYSTDTQSLTTPREGWII